MSSLLSGLLMDQHDCTRGKIYVLKTEIPNKTKAKKKKIKTLKWKNMEMLHIKTENGEKWPPINQVLVNL